MASASDKTVDPKQYLRILWRRKGVVLLSTVSLFAATLIGLTFVAEHFQSEATLIIEDRQPLTRDLELVIGGAAQSTPGYRVDEERLAKMVGRVRSRPFLERVIRILRMTEDRRIIEEANERRKEHPELTVDEMAVRILVKELQSRIQVRSAGSGVYKIAVADFSPENAQLLAKWISELFVEITIQNALEQIRAAREFGAEQLRVYESELRDSEEALERYQGSIIVDDLGQSVIFRDNLGAAEALEERVRQEVASSGTRANALGRSAGYPDLSMVIDGPDLRSIRERLVGELRTEINDRLTKEIVGNPAWPPTEGAIPGLRSSLYRDIEAGVRLRFRPAAEDTLKLYTRFAFAKVDALIQTEAADYLGGLIRTFKNRARSQPVDEMELARLQNEVAKNRQLLETFRAQMIASDIHQAVETTKLGLRIEILDPAQLPLAPSHPDRLKILMLALFMGPIVGAGLAFLSEVMDPTMRTLDDFTRVVPEPVLGTVPLVHVMESPKRGIKRHWVTAAIGGVVLVTAVFFVVKTTVLRDVAMVQEAIELADPEAQIPGP